MKIFRDLDDDFIITAKRRLRDIILGDEDIAELLKDDVSKEEQEKLSSVDNPFIEFGYVMPYIFVPTVQSKETCYVCMKLDEEAIDPDNPYILTRFITLVLFCSPKRQNIGIGANRLDVLAFCLKDLLMWSNPLGMSWTLDADDESVLTSGYIARTLEFRAVAAATKNRAKHPVNGAIVGSGLTYQNYNKKLNIATKRNRHGVEVYDDSEL